MSSEPDRPSPPPTAAGAAEAAPVPPQAADPFAAPRVVDPFAPPSHDPSGAAPYPGPPYGGAPYGAPYGGAPYGGAPHPGGPYGGGGYWQGPVPPATGTNGMAIASLVVGVLGLFCLAWTVGLGLGIAALRQIRRRPQRGRGLAVAGIVLSTCWGLVTLALSPYVYEGFKEGLAAGDRVAVFDLKAGDCMKEPTGDRQVRPRFTLVPCSEPHHGEVFGVAHLPGADYPGTARLEQLSALECIGPQYAYTPDYLSVPRSVESTTVYPEQKAWAATKRAICLFDSEQTRTGTLRQDQSRFTAEQSGYLAATRELDMALDAEPTLSVEDAVDEYQEWGRKVSAAATGAKSGLAKVVWSEANRQPMVELLAELDEVIAQGRKLHETQDEDVDALYDAYDALGESANSEADSALRSAIGLRSSAPDEQAAPV
ncbi:DUF4190 domain-containing protein [Kitasatospora sp. NPDC096147]|uniref:DUF4190 domain-containing protein n=1 Tax=Kitasatospora sp. NPDC096147 TaxID=3364093 RepID=UPI00380D5B51